ncbi:MAG TPA: hypothetical protein VGK25_07620, partial [Ignavibacteria bacterium]
SLGFWAKPNAPTFGLNYEYQISQLGEAGTISIGGVFRYTTYKDTYPFDDYYDYNYTTFGVQSNLNFNKIGDGKFVPFVGLVLGYNNINATFVRKGGTVIYVASYTSGAWLWGQAGLRYFFSPKVAGSLRIGAGNFNFNVIEIGVDFKL